MPNATSSDQKNIEAITAALPIPPDSEDQKRMYEALGGGLARWQFIETGLYLTALTLMGTDQTTCSLAFFQIKAAENKLAFVDRLIFHKLDQLTRITIWKPISDEIRAAIDFRNSLAHFEMFNLTDEEFAKIKPKTAFRAVLSPHHLDHHAKPRRLCKGALCRDDEPQYERAPRAHIPSNIFCCRSPSPDRAATSISSAKPSAMVGLISQNAEASRIRAAAEIIA